MAKLDGQTYLLEVEQVGSGNGKTVLNGRATPFDRIKPYEGRANVMQVSDTAAVATPVSIEVTQPNPTGLEKYFR